jgi:Ni/Co efflux regulator RcnB
MTLKKLGLGLLAFSLVAIPAAAQKSHSNKGGAPRGDNRSDMAQTATKKDKDQNPLPDNDKNKGKHKGETQGKHKAKGHSH